MRVAWLMALVLAAGLALAAGCSKSKSAAPAGPVGKVAALVGEVQATRAGQAARKLEVGADVFADDVIKTGVGARVELALLGGARYEIGAEAERKLGAQLALLKGGGGAGAAGDVTAAAGRHGEEEAAATEATAARAEASGGGAATGGGGSGSGGEGMGSGAPAPVPAPVPATAVAPGSAPDQEVGDAERAAAAAEDRQRELEELLAAEQRLAILKAENADKKTKVAERGMPGEPKPGVKLSCPPDNPLCDPSDPRPPRSPGQSELNEQLSAAQVKSVVLPALPNLRRCGEASFRKDKTLTALTVKINLEIAASGKVASVSVAEASAAKAYDTCVMGRASKLRFPKAQQVTKVRLPVATHP
ncbi:MAG: hypothetical protein IT370_20645 [Deltaproteobacteria bacterium]|nr:hypothetical protein [Deltaproteobacteria bacterium]